MDTKLYVGNLSYGTTEEGLRRHFAQAGTVTAVDLIKDRATGRSKGFAFVTMGSQAELEKAIQMFNGSSLDDRELVVNIARPREERGPGGPGGGRGGGGRPGGNRPGGNRNQNRGSGGGSRRY